MDLDALFATALNDLQADLSASLDLDAAWADLQARIAASTTQEQETGSEQDAGDPK